MKRTKTKIFSGAVLAVALIVAGLALWDGTPTVEAQKELGCNTANVAGTYSYAAFGTTHPGNLGGFPPGLYNSVATLYLDGMGNYTVTAETSYNGVIVNEQFDDS